MDNIFIYPGNDAGGLPLVFLELINDVSKTKLLVLGTDDISLKAQAYIKNRIAIDPDEYVSVSFIFITEPLLVLGDLKTLRVELKNPTHVLHWDVYLSYRVFSVSPGDGLISDVISATQLDEAYGSIDSAILCAMSNG